MILRIRYRVQGAHVHCRVFIGPHEGALGLCGELVFRPDEFEVIQQLQGKRATWRLEFVEEP
jgi:hypothetical protein